MSWAFFTSGRFDPAEFRNPPRRSPSTQSLRVQRAHKLPSCPKGTRTPYVPGGYANSQGTDRNADSSPGSESAIVTMSWAFFTSGRFDPTEFRKAKLQATKDIPGRKPPAATFSTIPAFPSCGNSTEREAFANSVRTQRVRRLPNPPSPPCAAFYSGCSAAAGYTHPRTNVSRHCGTM